MAIRVVCTCGFSKLVPDHWAGRKAKCKCGETIAVRQIVDSTSNLEDEEIVDPFEFLPKPKSVRVKEIVGGESPSAPASGRLSGRLRHPERDDVESTYGSSLREKAESFDSTIQAERLPLPEPHFKHRAPTSEQPENDDRLVATVHNPTKPELPIQQARPDSLPWLMILCAFLLFVGVAGIGGWSYLKQTKPESLATNTDGNIATDNSPTATDPDDLIDDNVDDSVVENSEAMGIPSGSANTLQENSGLTIDAPNEPGEELTTSPAGDSNTDETSRAIKNALGSPGVAQHEEGTDSPIQLNMVEDLLKKDLDATAIENANAPDSSEASPIVPESEKEGIGTKTTKDSSDSITAVTTLDSLLLTNALDPLMPVDQLPLQDVLTVDQKTKLSEINREVVSIDEKLALGHMNVDAWKTEAEKLAKQIASLLDENNRATLLKLLQSGNAQPITTNRLLEIYRPESAIPEMAWTLVPGNENRRIESKVGRLNMQAGKGSFIGHYPGSPLVSFSVNADPTKFVASVWSFNSQPNVIARVFVDKQDLSNALASDDGRHLAVIRAKGGSMVCEIWSVETGLKFNEDILSTAGDSDVPRPIKITQNTAYFLSRNKLTMWDFENGGKQEIELAANAEGKNYFGNYDFSPDNKYFVCLGKKTLTNPYQKRIIVFEVSAYDLNTLKKCGSFVYAPYDDVTDRSSIRFSPDGQQLAMLLRHGRSVVAPRRLVSINCADGQVQTEHEIEPYRMRRTSSSIFNRELIWLPDNSGWIVGLLKFVAKNSDEVVDFGLPQMKLNSTNPSADPERVIDVYPTTKGKLVFLVESQQSNGLTIVQSKSTRLPRVK